LIGVSTRAKTSRPTSTRRRSGVPASRRATSTWNALLGIYQRKDDFLKIGQLDDTDATPRIEHQQIRIAGDNSASATGQSQFEKFIVVGIAAVLLESAVDSATLTSMAATTVIQAELPPELTDRARSFVEEGWATDMNELLAEALRRFLESHSGDLTEAMIQEDVNWGLHGKD
jgi:hypothetical protein